MRDNITADHINEVLVLVNAVKPIRYQGHKKREFAVQVDSLSVEGRWLLSFCYWQCLFNPRFKHVDETAYFSIPYEHEDSTFSDFIGILRTYDRVKITSRRGAALGRFLSGCSNAHREFYFGLIGGNLIHNLPQHEAQSVLDIDDIISDEIYAVTPLKSGFGTLTYPIALRAISDEASPLFGGVVKSSTQTSYFGDKPNVERDIKFASWPMFCLTGFSVCDKFYPIDCFTPQEWSEYKSPVSRIMRKYVETPYGDRVEDQLNNFLTHNLITEMSDDLIEVMHSEDDLLGVLRFLVPNTGPTRLLLTDSNSSHTGEAKTFDVATAMGVIEELWVEDGNPIGLVVWFNGTKRYIHYKFEGKEQAILTAHERLRDQPFRFYRIVIGKQEILIGQTILWDTKKWRPKRMKKLKIWVEKCAMCGSITQKHASRGICKSCEVNLRYHYEKHGVDKAIRPSAVMRRSRLATCWSPALLHVCRVAHKGHLVRANHEGDFSFVKDEETMANYLKQKENQ